MCPSLFFSQLTKAVCFRRVSQCLPALSQVMEWDFPAADCTQYCVHVTVFKEEKCVREMVHREQKACNMLCHESLLLLSIYVDHMYTICIHMSHTYICDRSQIYGAMYHLTFLFIPLLRKAHIYSRKKIILTWWQNNNKTIPTGWKALHICSRVLYFYPAAFYVCIYMYNCMCIYIYIYIKAHVFRLKGIAFQYGDVIFMCFHSYTKCMLVFTVVTKYQLSQQFPAFTNYSWSVQKHCSYSSTDKILFIWAYHLTFYSFWRHTSLIK